MDINLGCPKLSGANLNLIFIMKQISLKNLKLEVEDLLQRESLKKVTGGYDPAQQCSSGYSQCVNMGYDYGCIENGCCQYMGTSYVPSWCS